MVKKRPLIEVADTEAQLFSDIHSKVTDAKNSTLTWAEKHDKWYRLRMRVKKKKSFPFPGSSNLRLPTIETYIRKAKSSLVGLYSNIKPRMQVIPQTDDNLEKAGRIERFLDWLADYKIKFLTKLELAADKMLEKGFVILEVDWLMDEDTRTEKLNLADLSTQQAIQLFDLATTDEMVVQFFTQQLNVDMSETVAADNTDALFTAVRQIREGRKSVNVQLKDELYNAPVVRVIDPSDFFVGSDSGYDVQALRLAGYEFYEPYETLKMWARQGIVSQEAVDNIDYIAQTGIKSDDVNKTVEKSKDLREGIDRLNNPSHLIKLQKVYTYYDLDKDGVEEKAMFLIAPDFTQVLKKVAHPHDHKKWPFVRFQTEIIDDRWFSPRGIPEHLEDISKEIDAQHNQKIDNQTIRNAPMFKFRSGIINPKLVRFMPGQGIPVPGMTPLDDAVKLMDSYNPGVDFSYEREELLLKTAIQEYLGVMDYSLQSMINKREPRTATEAQMQQLNVNQVFSLEASRFTFSLSELFTQILQLCQQYMPQRVYTLVTGSDGVEPLHLSRDEIQGQYQIVARGNDINTNPQVKLQGSMSDVQLLMSPVALQMGVVTPINVYNILKRYLQNRGEIAWKELLTNPAQQPPQQAGGQVPPQLFQHLTDAEKMQVLAKAGIQPDPQGRALQREQEITNAETEVEAKTAKTAASKRA